MSEYKYDVYFIELESKGYKKPASSGFIYDQSQNKLLFYREGSFFVDPILIDLNAIIDWDSIRDMLPFYGPLNLYLEDNLTSNFDRLLKALNNFLSSSKNKTVIKEILYYDNATKEEKQLIDDELKFLKINRISKKLAQNYYFVINKIYSELYKSDKDVVFPIFHMDRYIDQYFHIYNSSRRPNNSTSRNQTRKNSSREGNKSSSGNKSRKAEASAETETEIDPYEILGVERNAIYKEIQKAYIKLQAKYHPDKVRGAYVQEHGSEIGETTEEKIAEKTEQYTQKIYKLGKAFAILSDEKERMKYDSKHPYTTKNYTSNKRESNTKLQNHK
jgi:hypothetical protein